MLDVFKVAELLTKMAIARAGDEISLIAYYGSRAMGAATERSDLNIFYTPVDGKHPSIDCTVLVEGILFDFWPLTWATLEAAATGRWRGWAAAPALVAHAQILHARCEEDRARLAALKQKTLDLQKPESRPQMLQRALDAFSSVAMALGNLRLACADDDFASVRWAACSVVLAVMECLTLANQTYFTRGLRDIRNQLPSLERQPQGLEEAVVTLLTCTDTRQIATTAEELVLGTRRLLREMQSGLPARGTVREQFRAAYPEIREQLDKVRAACEKQNPLAASVQAALAQQDLTLMLADRTGGAPNGRFNLYHEYAATYRELGFPDLMAFKGSDLNDLSAQCRRLDEQVRGWLTERSVSLQEYATLEEFAASIAH